MQSQIYKRVTFLLFAGIIAVVNSACFKPTDPIAVKRDITVNEHKFLIKIAPADKKMRAFCLSCVTAVTGVGITITPAGHTGNASCGDMSYRLCAEGSLTAKELFYKITVEEGMYKKTVLQERIQLNTWPKA